MGTQEYLKLKDEKQNLISEIKKEILDLEKCYIQEHKKFDIDEKVIIGKGTKNERFAFVKDIYIDRFGGVRYGFLKCKKDGTKSMHTDYVFGNKTIDKI